MKLRLRAVCRRYRRLEGKEREVMKILNICWGRQMCIDLTDLSKNWNCFCITFYHLLYYFKLLVFVLHHVTLDYVTSRYITLHYTLCTCLHYTLPMKLQASTCESVARQSLKQVLYFTLGGAKSHCICGWHFGGLTDNINSCNYSVCYILRSFCCRRLREKSSTLSYH